MGLSFTKTKGHFLLFQSCVADFFLSVSGSLLHFFLNENNEPGDRLDTG